MMFVSFVGMARSTKSHKALTTIFTTHNLSSPIQTPVCAPIPQWVFLNNAVLFQ